MDGDSCLIDWDWGQEIADRIFSEYGLAMFFMFCWAVFATWRWVSTQNKFDLHRDKNDREIVGLASDTKNILNSFSPFIPTIVTTMQALKDTFKDEIRSLRDDILIPGKSKKVRSSDDKKE